MVVWVFPAWHSAVEFCGMWCFSPKHNSMYFSPESWTFVLSVHTTSLQRCCWISWWSSASCEIDSSMLFLSSVTSCEQLPLQCFSWILVDRWIIERRDPADPLRGCLWSSNNFVNEEYDWKILWDTSLSCHPGFFLSSLKTPWHALALIFVGHLLLGSRKCWHFLNIFFLHS